MSFNGLRIGGLRLRARMSGYTLKAILQTTEKALVTYLFVIELIYRLHIQFPEHFPPQSSGLADQIIKSILEHAPAQAWFGGVIYGLIASHLILVIAFVILVAGFAQFTSLLCGDPSPFEPLDFNKLENTGKANQPDLTPAKSLRKRTSGWSSRLACYNIIALMAAEIHRDHTKPFSMRAFVEQMGIMGLEAIPIIKYELLGLVVVSIALGFCEICTGFRCGIWIRKGLRRVGINGGLVRGIWKEKKRIGDEEAGYFDEKEARLEVFETCWGVSLTWFCVFMPAVAL
jgi:hypothetical protein